MSRPPTNESEDEVVLDVSGRFHKLSITKEQSVKWFTTELMICCLFRASAYLHRYGAYFPKGFKFTYVH